MQAAPATVLYPPLDDDKDEAIGGGGDDISINLRGNDTTNNEVLTTTESFSGDSCPTDEIRQRCSRRDANVNNNRAGIVMSQRLHTNFEALKRRKVDNPDEINSDHVALAQETADLAAIEIARMQRAVTELEQLLDEDDEDDGGDETDDPMDNRNAGMAVVPPPLVPRVVFVVESGVDEDFVDDNGNNTTNDGDDDDDHENYDDDVDNCGGDGADVQVSGLDGGSKGSSNNTNNDSISNAVPMVTFDVK